jgi:hypothetical protein
MVTCLSSIAARMIGRAAQAIEEGRMGSKRGGWGHRRGEDGVIEEGRMGSGMQIAIPYELGATNNEFQNVSPSNRKVFAAPPAMFRRVRRPSRRVACDQLLKCVYTRHQ